MQLKKNRNPVYKTYSKLILTVGEYSNIEESVPNFKHRRGSSSSTAHTATTQHSFSSLQDRVKILAGGEIEHSMPPKIGVQHN